MRRVTMTGAQKLSTLTLPPQRLPGARLSPSRPPVALECLRQLGAAKCMFGGANSWPERVSARQPNRRRRHRLHLWVSWQQVSQSRRSSLPVPAPVLDGAAQVAAASRLDSMSSEIFSRRDSTATNEVA